MCCAISYSLFRRLQTWWPTRCQALFTANSILKYVGRKECTYFESCLHYINCAINKYKIDIVRQICVLAFGKYNIYYNPTTGSIFLDCVKCGEMTAKSAVFKMADLNMCEVISFALVLKRSIQQQNKFIPKNKVDILVPWHPFSLNIIFIEFRMSGITEYQSYKKPKVLSSAPADTLRAGINIAKHQFSATIYLSLHIYMYTIDVFLCQSDKEKHMRIGEILISPILKLLSRIRWITSWLMEVTKDGGGLQLRWISLRTCSSVASAQGMRIADWSVSRALRVKELG